MRTTLKSIIVGGLLSGGFAVAGVGLAAGTRTQQLFTGVLGILASVCCVRPAQCVKTK